MALLNELKKCYGYFRTFHRKGLAHVNLQILYQCNFSCKICDFWKGDYKNKPRMTVEAARKVSEQLATMGPTLISIGGGEPLLHRDLIEICHVLAQNNFVVMICNGWFMTREKARAIWSAGLYEVSISVDYASAEKHDANRGMAGAYDRALEALRILYEERVHTYQRVHMITVVMDDNLADIEPLIQKARSMGITYLVTFYSDARGVKTRRHPAPEVSAHLLALKKRYPEFVSPRGYLERYAQSTTEQGVVPCRAGHNLMNIDCTGEVSPCIDHLAQTCGNILTDEMSTIQKALWDFSCCNTCGGCWTSCRGPIETLMYGDKRLRNLWDFKRMTQNVPLFKA